jgi:predicted enzyme related to lactoylglutathione lyase
MAQTNTAGRQEASTETRQKPGHGTFYWNELMTHDPERAKAFYRAAIGWTFEAMAMPNGTYWVAKAGEQSVGGIFTMSGPEFEGVPEHWMAYLTVDDVDARVAKAVAAGATVCRPAFDIPTIGRVAMLREPGGAMIGWITPAS